VGLQIKIQLFFRPATVFFAASKWIWTSGRIWLALFLCPSFSEVFPILQDIYPAYIVPNLEIPVILSTLFRCQV